MYANDQLGPSFLCFSPLFSIDQLRNYSKLIIRLRLGEQLLKTNGQNWLLIVYALEDFRELNCAEIVYFLLSENNLPVQFLPSPECPSLHAQV